MRHLKLPFLKPALSALLGVLVGGFMIGVRLSAQTTLYWDTNGTTAGAGTADGNWSNTNNGQTNRKWNASSAGTSNVENWTSGAYAVFSAGTDSTGSYTVTVSGTQNVGGITVEEGNPTISSGILNFNSSSPFVNVASGSTITFDSQLSGSNGLTKGGTGTMILNNAANNWTGAFAIDAGLVQLNTSNVIPNASAVTVAGGATLQTDWGVDETLGSLAGSGTVNFRTGTLTVGDSTNTTFSGVLQNSYGTFVKQGTGTLTLSGNNTYSGITSINAGALVAASDTALGSSTWGNTIASGAALHLQNNISLTEGQFSITGTGVGSTGAIRNLSGNNTLNAAIGLAGNATVGSSAGTLTVTGSIDLDTNTLTTTGAGNVGLSGSLYGSGGLTKTGTGTLTLSGSGSNSFSGTLAINGGTVALAKTAGTNAIGGGAVSIGDGVGSAGSAVLRLDASNQIANHSGVVTINADGVLQLNNFSESINTLAGTGLIDLSTSGYLGVGVNSGSSTFSGDITGSGTFAKLGSGTLTLTDDIDFSGTFELGGGTLSLSSLTLSAGTLLVSANSIIDFGGAASILDFDNLTIAAGVTLTIQNWTNATDFFFAQNWTGAAFNTGGSNPMNQVVFSGFSANDTKWQSYDRQVTPVPEPSTYGALLVGGLAAVAALRRRRARRD